MPVTLGPLGDFYIAGGGTAFPNETLTNEQVLRSMMSSLWPGRRRPIDDEQLEFVAKTFAETSGIEQRAWAHRVGTPFDHATETTTLDLAAAAAKRALEDARISASDLGLILCSTSTPHRMTSTLSAGVGAALGSRSACMDVRTGCSAVLFSLTTAALYLAAGSGPVLVVGSETFSKVTPPTNKTAAMSLGDGAGALVLLPSSSRSPGPPSRIRGAYLETDGALGRLVSTDGALPPTATEIDRGGYVLSGASEELLGILPEKYAAAIEGALGRATVKAGDIDLFVPHQTSLALITHVATAAGIPMTKTFVNVAKHANVGAAGCIVGLVEARAELTQLPKTVLLAAVGGGMSWAGLVLETG